jgi:hypothetical protein
MTGFPGSPRLIKGGIVLVDPSSGAVRRLIALQYNADTLTRTLQPQGAGGEGGSRSGPLRLKGPPIETIKFEAELDAIDQLEFPERNANAVAAGVGPQLAALETIVYPTSESLLANRILAAVGTLEIAPLETSLALFVWSRRRVVPVRITEFTITEEAFDTVLNPIRAKVSLALRVLSVDDLGVDHRGSSIYMAYQKTKESLAALDSGAALNTFGAGAIP